MHISEIIAGLEELGFKINRIQTDMSPQNLYRVSVEFVALAPGRHLSAAEQRRDTCKIVTEFVECAHGLGEPDGR